MSRSAGPAAWAPFAAPRPRGRAAVPRSWAASPARPTPARSSLACSRPSPPFPQDPIQYRGGWALDIAEFYAMAGVRADDVDFVQTYDDYPVICMMQMEDLGFCGKGEGPDFVRSHTLTAHGSFPHNTSGGQLSVGQACAAGGVLGLADTVRPCAD